MRIQKYTNIDEYLANFSGETRKKLDEMRKTIHEVVPKAKEKISYGIPTFELHGSNLVHFGGFKDHIGFFPGGAGVEVFKDELAAYSTSKGTIRLPLDKPLPIDLITGVVRFRVEQNIAKQK